MTLKRVISIPLLMILTGVAFAACGSDPGSSPDRVAVSDAWARPTPPGQSTGAIYATIEGGTDADRLIAVSVPPKVAGKAETHETAMAGGGTADSGSADHEDDDHMETDHMESGTGSGNMTMKPIHEVEIPAGETVTLAPGGLHIMLFDLAAPLKAGQAIPVTLTFKQEGEVRVDATVREE